MFWRLLGFLRPYRRGVIVSFVLAAVAMGAGVLIPFLVGRTIDEIREGETNLWPLALAIIAAGLLRLRLQRRAAAGRRPRLARASSSTCATGCTRTCSRSSSPSSTRSRPAS